MKELKRVLFISVMTVLLSYVFISGFYESFPPVFQLVLSKFLLVTTGILTAHITRKFLFPSVDWTNDSQWQLATAVIAFYLIIIYCFAMGG
jgi:hypothetical protein